MSGGAKQERGRLRASRARDGRILGGVCAGLSDIWGLGTNGLRLAFVVASLFGGVGVVLYVACWLVIPAADEDPSADAMRSVALAAWAVGALAALVLVAAGSAAATAIGLGWVVFVLAAIGLLVALGPLGRRVPPVATLLTVAALTLPAAAVALSPMRISLQSGESVSRPATVAELQNTVYRAGFGTQLVDLRKLQLSASGNYTIHVDGGLRRTIVALPEDQCVSVRVYYNVHTFVGQLATLLSGHGAAPLSDVVLFGRVYGASMRAHPHGSAGTAPAVGNPTLTIDFSSLGGGLFVRDYPESVDPNSEPNWPGFVDQLEPRPNLNGESAKAAKQMVRDYQKRLRAQKASLAIVKHLMGGPCAS
jgi:phage shock protein PspC (stress-responsive transcriptional regulator)